MQHPRYSKAPTLVDLESNDNVRFLVDLDRLGRESSFFNGLADLNNVHEPCVTARSLTQPSEDTLIPLPFCGAAIAFMLDCTKLPLDPVDTMTCPLTLTTHIIDDILQLSDMFDMPGVMDKLYDRVKQDRTDLQLLLVLSAFKCRTEHKISHELTKLYLELRWELSDRTMDHLFSLAPQVAAQLPGLKRDSEVFRERLERLLRPDYALCLHQQYRQIFGLTPLPHKPTGAQQTYIDFREVFFPRAWVAYRQNSDGIWTRSKMLEELGNQGGTDCPKCREKFFCIIKRLIKEDKAKAKSMPATSDAPAEE